MDDITSSRRTDILQRPLFHVVLLLLLGFLAYSNTFHAPFQFDDYLFLETFADRKGAPLDILSRLSGTGTPWGSRPLLYITFVLNFRLGGLDTSGYHAVNIALHLTNGIFLYLLTVMTGIYLRYNEKDVRLVAVFSSLLFVLHPVQTEAVTYIISRSMLLASAFFLSGLMLFLKAVTAEKRRNLYLAGLFVVSLLGMASRENFATFPVMLVVYDLLFISRFSFRKAARHWKAYLPVLASLAYFALLAINNTYDRSADFQWRNIQPLNYVLTQLNVHWTYLRLLVLPINQNLDYDYPVAKALFGFPTILSFIGYFGLWATAALTAKKRPLVSFPVLWFLVVLLPISFGVALMDMRLDDVIFEHRLYLPSVGLYVLGTAALVRMGNAQKTKNAIVLAMALVALLLGSASYARNEIWTDKHSLWSDVIEKSPGKGDGYNALGLYYEEHGQVDKALENFKTALRLEPENPLYHHNVADTYSKTLPGLALEHYLTALELEPRLLRTHNKLSMLYADLGLFDEAIKHLKIIADTRPDSMIAQYNLGVTYKKAGRPEKAREHLRKAVEITPNNIKYRNQLAATCYALEDYEGAIEQYETILRLNPGNFTALNNLALLYVETGKTGLAIERLEALLVQSPRYVSARTTLGELYLKEGYVQEAIKHLEIAVGLNPMLPRVHRSLANAYETAGDAEKAKEHVKSALALEKESGTEPQ